MGYHVHIINTNSKGYKIINNFRALRVILENRFNFIYRESNNTSMFCSNDDEDFTLFYSDNSLWANTTNDRFIIKMIEIAEYFDDGSRVRGDHGETFRSLSETYIHNDDMEEMINEVDQSHIKHFLYRYGGLLIIVLISLLIHTLIYIFD